MPQPCKLFVGGLSATTTTEVLRAHFSKHGHLVDAVVMSKQGRPRGFGFVTYNTPACAVAALSEPQWVGDRIVDVKFAVPGEQPMERAPNKIFVGGLPQDATTADLRACFAHYGPIADAVVMVDKRNQKRSRGFGFIRFASSVEGAKAADAVLLHAANHRLRGKWVEVKRATPAVSLQDLSPGSCTTASSPCTPTPRQQPFHNLQQHQQMRWRQQEFQKGLGLWGGVDGAALRSYGLTSAADGRGLAPFLNQGMWGGRTGLAGVADGLGMAGMAGMDSWEGSASPYSPMHFFANDSDLHAFSTTPTSHGRMAAYWPKEMDMNAPSDGGHSSASHSDSDEQANENKPMTANRAQTPPPSTKRSFGLPPGLASPMKVECHSKYFEGLTGVEDVLPGLSKVQTLLPAC